ncbi:NitT/TauT family transport system substrate-binding protein [Alkalispirochaeta americana]|uniref:NitT/TauT family transport system substrate-binding protein n=1 Tax=Alkalispirochaeta americana TaxID=159291 RepID=A0A1N6WBB7_9SPIO|nr:ABC transporter substrate-binding protein [Alkalispirochaeta americana]SIQ87384.1 NitT/TauT family transport system substrate-binding protein [Alkalispirochaeta americana]
MKNFITYLLAAALVAAAPLLLSADSARGTEQTVRIGSLRGPTSVGMAPLLHDPHRLAPYLDPDFRLFGTPDLLISQILAGEIDIAALPTNLAANLHNRGAGIRLLAISGGGVLYVVADRDMAWEDLRGETIFTLARGATPDILFQAMLRHQGLEPGRDVHLRYAPDQTELAQRLIGGNISRAVLPEPFVTRVTTARPELRVALELGSHHPMTALVVTDRFATDHPRALAHFESAYQEGLRWLDQNRAEGAAAAADQLQIPAPVIVSAFDRLNLVYTPAEEAREAVLDFLGIFLDHAPASVGGVLPGEEFFHRARN